MWAAGIPLVSQVWGEALNKQFEAYGMTETAGITHFNSPKYHRIGSVGRSTHVIETKIAEVFIYFYVVGTISGRRNSHQRTTDL